MNRTPYGHTMLEKYPVAESVIVVAEIAVTATLIPMEWITAVTPTGAARQPGGEALVSAQNSLPPTAPNTSTAIHWVAEQCRRMLQEHGSLWMTWPRDLHSYSIDYGGR
ncbi:hypothetical protein AK830_g7220 [Neonectria ditissima]|uniref:Uncharacterized protein n=1 Tax=Neonectria ditissima TaxID=78410 RepID=A0A0P7B088_9HYPO|nr:hypothetical protein AK830_g7220 [Neonectria ditissima]